MWSHSLTSFTTDPQDVSIIFLGGSISEKYLMQNFLLVRKGTIVSSMLAVRSLSNLKKNFLKLAKIVMLYVYLIS